MNSPLVSVVMPVYNAEKYVAEAVESILNQSYTNFEFIIIDDCSTDNSFEILKRYRNSDNRIKLFHNETNCKLPTTLNLAIDHAVGKYILRMDADDISLPDRLVKQVEFMEANPEIGVSGTWYNVFDDGMEKMLYHEQKPLEHDMILIYMNLLDNPIGHPTVILRREILKNNHYPEDMRNNAEDYSLWLTLSQKGIKFANLPEYTLSYRLSKSSLSQANQKNINLTLVEVISYTLTKLKIKHKKINYYLNAFVLPGSLFSKLYNMLWSTYVLKEIENNNRKIQIFPEKELSLFVRELSIVNKLIRKVRLQ
ncbi:glycosyltransferase family 2 protein [Aquella oligotrophica]|uniref:Glycosyl transferase n=1 Tax=Aquella oligotrophica TaxID=2067065 RepID=A0A2I7N547_9NEIS|nr:glycosyltransferase family 2 protein [Aquella oligotrophica]AUR51584.1 glycosyl transferase [Aquella oligotrophica]